MVKKKKVKGLFLIMGIITVIFIPSAVPVMKMHGAQCTVHILYPKVVPFLQHPFATKVPHEKDCSPHRKLPHRNLKSKGEILSYLNYFFLIFILQIITELHTFQEVTGYDPE